MSYISLYDRKIFIALFKYIRAFIKIITAANFVKFIFLSLFKLDNVKKTMNKLSDTKLFYFWNVIFYR